MAKIDFLFGPPDIAKLKQKGDIRLLSAALGYQKDAAIRRSAAVALGELRDAAAIPGLIQALGSETDTRAKLNCIKSLGMIGDKRATEPLLLLIQSNKGDVSTMRDNEYHASIIHAAIYTLGEISDERAVNPLIGHYKDTQRQVFASQIIDTLGKIGSRDAVGFLVSELSRKFQNKAENIYRDDCVQIIKHLAPIGTPAIIKVILDGLKVEYTEYPDFFKYCDILEGKYQLKALEVVHAFENILEKNWPRLEKEDLTAIVSMKDVTYSYVIPEHNRDGSDGWGSRGSEKVDDEFVKRVYDCSAIRNRAQQELDARFK